MNTIPPQRKSYHVALSPEQSATILISQYLAKRMGDCKDKDERAAIRKFIRQLDEQIAEVRRWNSETAWNWLPTLPIPTLRAVNGTKYGTVEIRVFAAGRGHLDDMPTLILPRTGSLAHIVRETSTMRLDISPSRNPAAADSKPKGFPPKPEAELIRGKR